MAQEPGGSGEEWSRYALALETSQEGFWDWDLVAGRLWGSRRWKAILGLSEAWAGLDAWMERVHPQDKPGFEAELRALRAGTAREVKNEHRVRQDSGEWRWVEARGIAARDAEGRVTHVAGSLMDNTACRLTDALTGLPNGAFFAEHLERRLDRARQGAEWDFAVLALALDRFERMHETLGSGGGDRLLMETAWRLQGMLPDTSLAARVVGADFLVCLEGARTRNDAARMAEELVEAVRQPFVWEGHRMAPQLAVGVAQATPWHGHPEELVSDARSALAAARRQEPPGVVCCSSGMREKALARMELEADLERAIQAGELRMHYQPEVDLRTGRIIGFEALVRWQHARRGLLPPGEFIPVAEETGLILPLGDWGLGEACRQMVAWQQSGNEAMQDTRISVNLSARQFDQADLAERVGQVLEETGLRAASLRLELTESSVLSDGSMALETMRALGRLGVGLHIDDFGTGYSSFDYLQRYPFDTLKIDRTFVQGIACDQESRLIVSTILDLARSFGMDVVAEGIEDAQQLEELKTMGCPCGQGYYFARPMEASAIDAMVRSGGGRMSMAAALA
ncbi:MAG TPA: GGDEF and EAL domain-containing protein [Acidobacteriaceae bacterium]|jgi:diguanylate cyclase (GGDEF)-like protein/PAS domain S-box-containing protein|nr:GGDEF and EAL domain-containing protein [Acidobacteriaceae bacterium]